MATAKRFPRGNYPSNVLAKIPAIDQRTGKLTTVKVLKETAAAFMAFRSYLWHTRGKLIHASAPAGGYRSIALERWMRTHFRWLWPNLAPVGQSNHNEADCIDIFDWRVIGDAYLDAHDGDYGFSQPISSEPWHRQHNRSDKFITKEKIMADGLKLYRTEEKVRVGNKVTTVKTYFTFDGLTLQLVPGPISKVTLLRQALGLTASTKRTRAQLDELAAAGTRHAVALAAKLKG